MKRWGILLFLLLSPASAQDGPANGLLLVAKPGLSDPRFRQAVVLVHQTPNFNTVGVILNKPLQVKASQLLPDAPAAQRHGEPVYFGGPVMQRTAVALFKSEAAPSRTAFHVHRHIYLSMHPEVIAPLLGDSGAKLRLFAGFSGWAPRQLQGELERDDWYVLPATEELLFRKNPSGMWEELIERARGKRAALYWPS